MLLFIQMANAFCTSLTNEVKAQKEIPSVKIVDEGQATVVTIIQALWIVEVFIAYSVRMEFQVSCTIFQP